MGFLQAHGVKVVVGIITSVASAVLIWLFIPDETPRSTVENPIEAEILNYQDRHGAISLSYPAKLKSVREEYLENKFALYLGDKIESGELNYYKEYFWNKLSFADERSNSAVVIIFTVFAEGFTNGRWQRFIDRSPCFGQEESISKRRQNVEFGPGNKHFAFEEYKESTGIHSTYTGCLQEEKERVLLTLVAALDEETRELLGGRLNKWVNDNLVWSPALARQKIQDYAGAKK